MRQDLLARYGINLQHNTQLARFRDWVVNEDLRKQAVELVKTDEEELTRAGLSGEQLRDALLMRMKARAFTLGDFKLAVQALKLDLKAECLQFDKEKRKEALRTKIQAGLDEVAEALKVNPQTMESCQKARTVVVPETKP